MAERSPPSGTVAFVFTDIEGSTRLWDAHGPAMGMAVAAHDRLLRSVFTTHGGYVFKTIGDAFCAAFSTPADALAAAVSAQRALAAQDWGQVDAIKARMALHAGQAEERDADYFGPTVNRVARLLAAGHGGQILVSLAMVSALGEHLPAGVQLRDLGDRRLKDLTQPERVYQVVAAGLPDGFPPLNSLDARPNNLPIQVTQLLGREDELVAVKHRLRQPGTRLLTLTGPGGTGKTRLALQAAADLIDDFPHGVWFVDLSAATDPQLVPAEIARALGIREEGATPLSEQVATYLRDKELLLVLDNFEQILPAAGRVATLLAGSAKLAVLVTSRAPLRISAEREFPVPPLPLPDPRRLSDPIHLAGVPAVRLFVERARAVEPDFALSAENAQAVAEICVALDGLPLAIELAAARIRMLSPQRMLPRLEDRLKFLAGGGRDRAARQQTLRGTIAWSYDLLGPQEQTLFARLSVFAGGCTLEAAEAAANAEGELDVFEGLGQLVEHSLLRKEAGQYDEPRFAMLATIRAFAHEQLEHRGEAEAVRQAHAQFMLAVTEQAEAGFLESDHERWLDCLETEHDNIRASLAWCLDGNAPELGLRLAGGLGWFWRVRGHWSEGRRWLERALGQPSQPGARLRAKALRRAAELAGLQGDHERAVTAGEAALAIYRRIRFDDGIAASLYQLAEEATTQGDHERARMLFEEGVALLRGLGPSRREDVGVGVFWLGVLAFLDGDVKRAKDLYQESLDLYGEHGNKHYVAGALCNLGEAWHRLGDHERAAALYEQASELFGVIGEKTGLAFVQFGLGRLAMEQGDAPTAIRSLLQSIGISQEIGDQPAMTGALESLAVAIGALGDGRHSVRLLAAAHALRERLGIPRPVAYGDEVEQRKTANRSDLGQGRYEELWSAGLTTPVNVLIAEVRDMAE